MATKKADDTNDKTVTKAAEVPLNKYLDDNGVRLAKYVRPYAEAEYRGTIMTEKEWARVLKPYTGKGE